MEPDLPPDHTPAPAEDAPVAPAPALLEDPDAPSEPAAPPDPAAPAEPAAAATEPGAPHDPTDRGEPGGADESAAAPEQGAGDEPRGDGGPGGSAPPGPSGGPGGWAPPFQFLRSRQERKLGGVAGGLAAASGVDPTLVRAAIVLGCLTGWGILGYLIAWAIIPEENPALGRYLVPAPERTARHVRIGLAVLAGLGVLHVLGAILGVVSSALIGLGLFPARLFGLHHRGFMPGEALLGLLLLAGGLVLLFRRHLPWAPASDAGSGAAWYSGPSAGWVPPAATPPGSAPWGAGPPAGSASGSGSAASDWAGTGPPPGSESSGAFAAGGSGVTGGGLGARASAAARAARTNGPLLLVRALGWLVGLWFLAAAVVGTVFWITGALHVHLPLLPIAAGVGALGLLAWTLVRSRRVTAVIGALALLLVPTALAAALTRVDGQAGHRSVTPVALSDLEGSYRHAAGLFELDLSRLQLPAGPTPVRLSIGAGKIDVTVPWDAEVQAAASVGAGSFDLFGNRQTGVNLQGRTHSGGQPGGPLLVITGRAGAGEIVVQRASEPFTHEALRTGQPVPMRCDLSVTRTAVNGIIAGGPVRCTAADGVTVTPALNCVVAFSGPALCRPVGEPEPAVDFANEAGTRHCQVPAGGGDSTCTGPVSGTNPAPGSFTCSIPEDGGSSVCRPSGSGSPSGGGSSPGGSSPGGQSGNPADPNAPAPPTPPATPAPTGAAPGEYHCSVPAGGGPATCEPA